MLEQLIKKNRSYRRFKENESISEFELKALVDMARCSASAANLQPLKYIISNDPGLNARIFPCLAWAGYLKEWPGPAEGERPSAYIIILGDTEIAKNFSCDHGIAAQSILLGAVEKGYGGCMVGAIDRPKLCASLNIPNRYEILLVIALGKPAEEVVIEDIASNESIKYYRDSKDMHHVPKRMLEDIIIDL